MPPLSLCNGGIRISGFLGMCLAVLTTLLVAWSWLYHQKNVQLPLNFLGSALGTPLSSDNEWVHQIPWPKWEEAYQLAFPSKLGRTAKTFRQLYGTELIKQRTGLSDRELVGAMRDAPAFQYFMGLPGYQAKAPFTFSSLSYFRWRIASISEQLRKYHSWLCASRTPNGDG